MTILRQIGAVALILASAAAFGADSTRPHADEHATELDYRVVPGWPVLPAGEVLGSVAGVAVDSHNNVFVFHRANRKWPGSDVLALTTISRPTIEVFDGHTGVLRQRWGANLFAMPHGLSIDDHDNVWLTDLALQQVYKFSPDGHLLLTLGERGVAGHDSRHFNRPTAVAVSPDGSFYVSDGYRNTRVMKFAADGSFLFQWGTKGTGPGQFDLPHGITLDAAGRVYVADRSNQRVQVFDASGHFLRQWKGGEIGRPYAVAIDQSGTAFVADGGDQAPPGRSAFVVLQPDGTPIARFGRFKMAHSLAIDSEGSVYIGDITGARAQKFVPSPSTHTDAPVTR
jgi:peptidylamidoglycolate lyase